MNDKTANAKTLKCARRELTDNMKKNQTKLTTITFTSGNICATRTPDRGSKPPLTYAGRLIVIALVAAYAVAFAPGSVAQPKAENGGQKTEDSNQRSQVTSQQSEKSGALAVTPQIYASVVANLIINQINGLAQLDQVLKDGVPAQNGNPAVSGADLTTALGPANVAKIHAVVATLTAKSGNSKPQTPNPK
jgi:hypothetical protein